MVTIDRYFNGEVIALEHNTKKYLFLLSKLVINLSIVVVFLLFVLFSLYLFHGSLEMLPTKEQQEKIRVVSGFIIVFLVILDLGLLFARKGLIKLYKKE